MAYFKDLSPCNYFGPGFPLIAVGWLDDVQPFPTGPVPPDVMQRLLEFCRNPWSLVQYFGLHICELCPPQPPEPYDPEAPFEDLFAEDSVPKGPGLPGGTDNLFIPAPSGIEVYVAPCLIVHYIEKHHYCPPVEFQEALMQCPPMNSTSYLDQLRTRGLLQA